MEIDISAEAFLNLGKSVEHIQGQLDKLNKYKPLHYAVAGSAATPAGTALTELDVSAVDRPPAGRIWGVLSVALQCPTGLTVNGPTISASGSVTSPGAGATICQTAAVSPGLYSVVVTTYLQGTVSATDINNMQLGPGNPNAQTLGVVAAVNVPVTATYTVFAQNPTNHINVKSIAAGTVGAVYNASITATPIGTGMSADVFCGLGQLTPDISSQILFAAQTTVPGIYYFPEKANWSKYGDTLFARVYNVAPATTVSLMAKVAEYPLEAVEALSVG